MYSQRALLSSWTFDWHLKAPSILSSSRRLLSLSFFIWQSKHPPRNTSWSHLLALIHWLSYISPTCQIFFPESRIFSLWNLWIPSNGRLCCCDCFFGQPHYASSELVWSFLNRCFYKVRMIDLLDYFLHWGNPTLVKLVQEWPVHLSLLWDHW